MPKKIYLDVLSEPAFFTLIGISCHLKDYRLSHHLNKIHGFNFSKEAELSLVQPGKTEASEFSFFYYRDEDLGNAYSLIANRSDKYLLVPEMKQVDFILIVDGTFNKARKDQVLASIRKIQNVLTAFEVRLGEIKNVENLLSEIELHIMNILKPGKMKVKPVTKL
jgi:hypothetical protein